MTTFTQLNARPKNYLMGWLFGLGLKECLLECATLCIKSEGMLPCKYIYSILGIQKFLLEKMPISNVYKIFWTVAHMILCYFWTLIQFWKTLIPSLKLWFKICQFYHQCFWQTRIWLKNAKNVILAGIDLVTTELPFLMGVMGDYLKNHEHL